MASTGKHSSRTLWLPVWPAEWLHIPYSSWATQNRRPHLRPAGSESEFYLGLQMIDHPHLSRRRRNKRYALTGQKWRQKHITYRCLNSLSSSLALAPPSLWCFPAWVSEAHTVGGSVIDLDYVNFEDLPNIWHGLEDDIKEGIRRTLGIGELSHLRVWKFKSSYLLLGTNQDWGDWKYIESPWSPQAQAYLWPQLLHWHKAKEALGFCRV